MLEVTKRYHYHDHSVICHGSSLCTILVTIYLYLSGSYPGNLKLSKVIPIFKKNDELEINNYRLISLFPVISKIFEYVMHTQLLEYFTENNL